MRNGMVQAAEASGSSWGLWVAAVGVVGAAVVAAIATGYTAKKKVREVELSYAQRLQDSYLNNAREYLQSVYLPLHLAISDLVTAHRDFRTHADRAAGTATQGACIEMLDVERTIAQLPEKQSQVLRMEMDGFSTAEIAQAMHVRESTARTHLASARRYMREMLHGIFGDCKV